MTRGRSRQPTLVARGLATTTIAYDGDGVRVKKADPSGTTYYLGTIEVLITGTTQVTTSYYAFGGVMVAMRTAATATLTYLHSDHLGSTSLTTNAAGQKVSEQRYKPYGEVRWASGAGLPTDPSTDRITGPLRAGFTFTLRLRSGQASGLVVTASFLYPPGSICRRNAASGAPTRTLGLVASVLRMGRARTL